MLSSLFFCPLMPVSRDALSLSVPSAGAYEASFTGRVESERSLEVSVTLTCFCNTQTINLYPPPLELGENLDSPSSAWKLVSH